MVNSENKTQWINCFTVLKLQVTWTSGAKQRLMWMYFFSLWKPVIFKASYSTVYNVHIWPFESVSQSAIHVFTVPCRLCLLKTCLNNTRSPPYWMDSKITNDFLLFWSLTQVTLLTAVRIIQSVYTYICTIKFANPYFKINLYQLNLCALVQKIAKTKTKWKSTHIECHIKQPNWTEHVTMAAKPSLKIPRKEDVQRQIIIAVLSFTNTYTQMDRIFLISGRYSSVGHHVCLFHY